ncbi:MAG: hybrid sensor histidine kinase/response regulator [Cyanobacteria bacterium J06560_2]
MLSEQSLTSDIDEQDVDDRLLFADELVLPAEGASAANGGSRQDENAWKIMLVDDEPSVHQATKVALKFFRFEGRSLRFMSAYSEAEAKQLIAQNPDTVLMLLDVIMKTQNAGLQVAQYIRETLKNRRVRIVLRTGQPGQVPEESVVINYDINDYKTKLELTQEKLFTTIVSSIRAYRDLTALENSQTALANANLALETFNQNLEERIRDRTRLLAHEVEERKKAEAALKLYIHALTHDLRNPVTGMNSVFESLLNREFSGEPPATELPKSLLTRMKSGCDRQLKMIGTLLETHDIEVRGVVLDPQPFAIEPFIAEIVEDWQLRCEKKRATLQVEVAPDLPLLEGDRTQLWRVFENLIDNAIKYNPPGITITLAIGLSEQRPNFIHCMLSDNGVGMPAQQSGRLFQLYQRGQEGSPTRGLGLGLYVCRRIVEAHGGTIRVSSRPDEGSQFCFLLPCEASPSAPLPLVS